MSFNTSGFGKSHRPAKIRPPRQVPKAFQVDVQDSEEPQPREKRQERSQQPSKARPTRFRAEVESGRVRTPNDLATYFADSVSTSSRPYQQQPWMADWFAERLGETRWCGPTPEVPVLMTPATYVLAIDHWSSRNRDLVGRQIWSSWAQWAETADLLDEGVVGFSTGPTKFERKLSRLAQEQLGIDLDPEVPGFRERLEEELESRGSDVGALVLAEADKNRWWGRANQIYQAEVADCEEQGIEPPSFDEVLARVQEERERAMSRRAARDQELFEERERRDSGSDDEEEDDGDSSTGPRDLRFTAEEAAELTARLAASARN